MLFGVGPSNVPENVRLILVVSRISTTIVVAAFAVDEKKTTATKKRINDLLWDTTNPLDNLYTRNATKNATYG